MIIAPHSQTAISSTDEGSYSTEKKREEGKILSEIDERLRNLQRKKNSLEEALLAISAVEWPREVEWKERIALIDRALSRYPTDSLPEGYKRLSHYLAVALPALIAYSSENSEGSSSLNLAMDREVIALQGECLAQFGGNFEEWRGVLEAKLLLTDREAWKACCSGIARWFDTALLPEEYSAEKNLSRIFLPANERRQFWEYKEKLSGSGDKEGERLKLLRYYMKHMLYPKSRYQRSYSKPSGNSTHGGKIAFPQTLCFPEGPLFTSEIRALSKTAFCNNEFFELLSLHKYVLSFRDEEIEGILPVKSDPSCQFPLVGFLDSRRPVFQQQSVRGCRGATCAMLLSYHSNGVVWPKFSELEDEEPLLSAIRDAEMEPVQNFRITLERLESLLEEYGPAECSLHMIGANSVIVDAVTERGVELRDPYHGWAPIVSSEAFRRAGGLERIIQAKKSGSSSPPSEGGSRRRCFTI